jgi:hypothetical protein
MKAVLSISLPLPPPELSPNSRIHWRRRAELTKRARSDASAVAMLAMHQSGFPFPWLEVELRTSWYWRDKRSMSDDDNLIGRFKAVRDGIADAGVVSDDRWFRLDCPIQCVDRNAPRLDVIMTGTLP